MGDLRRNVNIREESMPPPQYICETMREAVDALSGGPAFERGCEGGGEELVESRAGVEGRMAMPNTDRFSSLKTRGSSDEGESRSGG